MLSQHYQELRKSVEPEPAPPPQPKAGDAYDQDPTQPLPPHPAKAGGGVAAANPDPPPPASPKPEERRAWKGKKLIYLRLMNSVQWGANDHIRLADPSRVFEQLAALAEPDGVTLGYT